MWIRKKRGYKYGFYRMNKNRYEFENNVEIYAIEIAEKEYSERVVRVIKWLLEMAKEDDKTCSQVESLEEAA
jgi:hypothetical protein